MRMFMQMLGGAVLAGLMVAGHAQAGELEDTCNMVYRELSSGPYATLTQSMGEFKEEGQTFRGCVIQFSGNATKLAAAQHADRLFGDAMPYCPDGKYPAQLAPGLRNAGGWCDERPADGPDGMHARVVRGRLFCVVEGSWDGGEDDDPRYVPSTRYEVTVRCARR